MNSLQSKTVQTQSSPVKPSQSDLPAFWNRLLRKIKLAQVALEIDTARLGR
jgi:hypothetical protein